MELLFCTQAAADMLAMLPSDTFSVNTSHAKYDFFNSCLNSWDYLFIINDVER